jgi:hypothetical protein
MAGWPSEDELIVGAILATDSDRATTEMSRIAAWHSLPRLVGSQHSRLWESRGNSTRGGINAVLAADALGAHDEVTQTRKAGRGYSASLTVTRTGSGSRDRPASICHEPIRVRPLANLP